MAGIGVMNIAPEVDFACHEYEAWDGNLIPNSTYGGISVSVPGLNQG